MQDERTTLLGLTDEQLAEFKRLGVRITNPGREISFKKVGKSKDPEFKRVMVLLLKDTEKRASRQWEDTQPDEDFSDLIEKLLQAYIAGIVEV